MAKNFLISTFQEGENQDDLLNFPCEFPLKVMGLVADDFEKLVMEIMQRHCNDLKEGAVATRTSRGGKYMSLTITITAKNRAQLDGLYMELSQHERVVMVL
jgi:putative lipoic acid-binding regulatory protein